MQQQTQQQIQQEAEQARQRDLLGMILGSEDIAGQRVDVQQAPLAKIDYTYDIGSGSIFGGGNRAGFYERLSPYGPTTAAPPRGFFGPPPQRKRGGIIEANNELLQLLGEK